MIQTTIQTIDLRGLQPTRAELLNLIPRPVVDIAVASEAAATLIAEVRNEGEAALQRHAAQFDRVHDVVVRVDPAEIAAAVDALDPDVRDALEASIARVRIASEAQLHAPVTTTLGPDARIHQRWQPVDRVGLYVPGGKAALSSSVVMNVVPAQVAGVRSIALASPAQSEFGGRVHPTILGAAGLLGIDEVYTMGGASAIGALAYGVPSLGLDPVDVVTGPGNIYVAAAKRLVRGVVGIDSEAGTTEILVIADETANARYVAADLISQAEHDEAAASLLVTTSADLAEQVIRELGELAAATPNSARVIEALGGQQSAIVLVDDLAAAARFSNAYGPEHLEIQTTDDQAVLSTITSAGAIFLGPHSPVSVGDYLAGSNHVLPTGGQARFSSGLGAYTFLRPQQVIDYGRGALEEVAAKVVALSGAEALPAHGAAVTVRFS
ncbi:histidinol dehydrogenase [Mycetocola zhadangensis]|uniref:histidinol dehydrogenase n=1 Tax=Mycetocola zhadangensis TaxID=1164595 RepID=UPI003A4D2C81